MRTLNIFIVFACTIIFLSACSGNKEDKNNNKSGTVSFSNDLETSGWMNQSTVTKEFAHSGRCSSRIDSVSQFSFGFADFFYNISDIIPEKVDVNFWILCPQKEIRSNLVVSIDSIGKNIFWIGIDLKDSVPVLNQWKEVKSTINLPADILATDKISIYVWSNDKKVFYLDDLKVTFGKK